MIRRLILMRHAKSSWKSDAITDHTRPLNPRGQRDAPRIGQALAERRWNPDLVLSSDARRTQETWTLMAPLFPDVGVRFEPELYLAGLNEIRTLVAPLSEDTRTLLLLGHNPGWEEALAWLTGSGEPMKTAYAALLIADAQNWAETIETPGCFRKEAILKPKELPVSPPSSH